VITSAEGGLEKLYSTSRTAPIGLRSGPQKVVSLTTKWPVDATF